jgi:hypothetical protein
MTALVNRARQRALLAKSVDLAPPTFLSVKPTLAVRPTPAAVPVRTALSAPAAMRALVAGLAPRLGSVPHCCRLLVRHLIVSQFELTRKEQLLWPEGLGAMTDVVSVSLGKT